MKSKTLLCVLLLLLNSIIAISNEAGTEKPAAREGTFSLNTSPDLYNLTVVWANQYQTSNPQSSMTITRLDSNKISAIFSQKNGLTFTSDRYFLHDIDQPVWRMNVGREVIVAVFNPTNPLIDEISKKGVSFDQIANILKYPESRNWSDILGNKNANLPMSVFVANDLLVLSSIKGLIHSDFIGVEANEISDTQQFISSVCSNKGSIGFCRLTQIANAETQRIDPTLKFVPIDKNNNGKIDYMEDIYDNLQSFNRGVWIGKYPKEFVNNIYAVALAKPQKEAETSFLRWVLTDGQQYLNANGYSDLVFSERQSQLEKIAEPLFAEKVTGNSEKSIAGFYVAIFILVIVFGAAILIAFRKMNTQKEVNQERVKISTGIFDAQSMSMPQGLYFDKTHTWAFRRKNGFVKIGIDDFLQHVTGEITRVEMKNPGERIKKGNVLFSMIRKGKSLNIYSPVSGVIKETNFRLKNDISLLNQSPYTAGWIYQVEPVNWELEVQYLDMADKYKVWLKGELIRLKDFLVKVFQVHSPEFAQVVLQDGGTIKDQVLADLTPEIWEDFQTNFIDVSK